jgi:hypothetical protein
MDQKYWITDVDGELMFFESSLDVKAAALEVALKQAALDERAAVLAFMQAHPEMKAHVMHVLINHGGHLK